MIRVIDTTSNDLLNDKRISDTAKELAYYIADLGEGLPQNDGVSDYDISKYGDSDYIIQHSLNELKNFFYLNHRHIMDKQGNWSIEVWDLTFSK